MEPVAFITHYMYDETPLPLQSLVAATRPQDNTQQLCDDANARCPGQLHDKPHGSDGPQVSQVKNMKNKGRSKVLQTEIIATMLLKESDKGYFTFVVPISCPLVPAGRSTGEVLRTNIHKHLDVPMMRETMEAFDFKSEHTTTD